MRCANKGKIEKNAQNEDGSSDKYGTKCLQRRVTEIYDDDVIFFNVIYKPSVTDGGIEFYQTSQNKKFITIIYHILFFDYNTHISNYTWALGTINFTIQI